MNRRDDEGLAAHASPLRERMLARRRATHASPPAVKYPARGWREAPTRHRATMPRHVSPAIILAAVVIGVLCTPVVAHAAGAGAGAAMPWTGPLQALLDNLSGPTARIVAGLGFVIGGGIWAFSRSEEGAKRFGQIVIGAAIAIGAANIVTSLAFVGAVL
jgi:type IV secretion system protein TrbC